MEADECNEDRHGVCAQRRRAIAKVCGALAARGDIVVRVHLQERALGDVRRGASSPSVVAVLTAHTNALGAFWALDLNRCRGAVLCGITNARTGLAFHVHSTPAEAVLLAFDPMGQPNERHERHRHRQRRRPGLHAFDAYSPIEGTLVEPVCPLCQAVPLKKINLHLFFLSHGMCFWLGSLWK